MAFAYIEEVDALDTLLSSTVAEDTDYPAWDDSPTNFDTGDRCVTPSTHQVWESVEDSNVNNDPLLDAAGDHWVLVGPTNKFKLLDQSPQSQTVVADTMTYVFQPGAYINALALLEVDAATVTVQQFLEVTNEIYSRTFNMISDDGILDYEPYFFWPVERESELYLNDLLPFAEAQLSVTFDSSAGEDVACGVLRFGREVTIGNTQWGGRVGIDDYSIKTVDDFDQATILERAFNRTGEYSLILTPAQVDAAYRRLSRLRATAVVWVADPDYGAALIYGYVNDFAVEFGGPTVSYANISIKGLA